MASSKASKRYAKALFDLAREKGQLEVYWTELAKLQALLGRSPELRTFIRNDKIAPAKRVQILGELFERQGSMDPAVFRFILFPEEKGRLGLLPEIIERFRAFYDVDQGIQRASLVSALPLTDQQLEFIRTRMATRFNKKIELVTRVDARLVGGFRLQVNDMIYDSSVDTKLKELHRRLVTA